MKTLWCFLTFLGTLHIMYAQEIPWKRGAESLDIADKIYVFEDTSNKLTIQQIISPAYAKHFHLSNQSILHFGLTNSIYWLRFTLENKSNDPLWLQLEHAFIPYANLFVIDSNGTWKSYQSGYKVSLKDKLIKDHTQMFPLLGGKHQYYVRVIPYMHPIPVKIWNSHRYQLISINQKIVYGIYLGILFFAIAVHLFLFITLRFSYYLMYCLLILSYINASVGVMEGYLIYLFPHVDLMYFYKIIPVINMPILLIYCLSFLDIKKVNPKLYKLTNVICLFLVIYLFGLHYLPTLPVLFINYLFALFIFSWACYIGFVAGREGNKLGYYYTFTFSIWFLLLFIEELNIQFGIPPHIFALTYVAIATLVESFLLALLLAKRFQWNKQEDEKAKFELQKNIYEIQEKFDKESLTAQLEVQNTTLQHIGEELHDNIGQMLSVARINLNVVEEADRGADNREFIRQANELIARSIQDLRALTKSLDGDFVEDFGLVESVAQELQRIRHTRAFGTELRTAGDAYPLGFQREIVLYRIVQEVINNALKHSEAKQLTVDINYTPALFTLILSDDGKGFEYQNLPEAELNKSGAGLRNIQRRASLIGATCQLVSSPGNGTTTTITLPNKPS